MTDQQWADVWKVYQSLQALPADQRSGALRAAGLGGTLPQEIHALLELSTHCTVVAGAASNGSAVLPAAALRPGDELAQYTVVGIVGEGGFGAVYAARDRRLHRDVAIKVLHRGAGGSGSDALMEARAASALNHPNILTVHETLDLGDRFAIVTEFVDGNSIRELLLARGEALSLPEVVGFGRQIAAGLREAHDAGITHCDIKPENVLLRRKNNLIKLVDFGLSRNTASDGGGGAPGGLEGTIRYLAPEQIAGDAASPASDVFAFGLVLYEFATGTHPFRRESPIDSAVAIATADPERPSKRTRHIPRDLERLILSMLDKSPAARPSAADVYERLARLEAGSHKSGRKAVYFGVAALGLLAFAAALAWTWISPPRKLQLHLETRLLTGEPGLESSPAISPDGRYVIYQWRPSGDGPKQTILRDTETEQTTRLAIPAPFAWPPSGERIGFIRRSPAADRICTVKRDGSGEECVVEAGSIGQFAWSPDGEFLAYAASLGNKRQRAIFRYILRTRTTAQVTFPPSDSNGDDSLAISGDSQTLAFRRTSALATSDIFVADLARGQAPRQISFAATEGGSLAWLMDRSGLLAASMVGAHYSLYLHDLRTGREAARMTEVGLETFDVTSAARRQRLAWTNTRDDSNIWRVPASGGRAERFIGSTTRERDVDWSRTGLVAFRSDRSGYPEIWIARADGRDERKITNLKGFTGSPRWSPDGRTLVFDSQRPHGSSDLYRTSCSPETMQCEEVVRLTDHPSNDAVPNWSADGSHIYFGSQRSGSWQIWRIAAGTAPQPPPRQITTSGGLHATESSDGKWLYYSRIDSPAVTGIWRKRVGSAEPGTLAVRVPFRGTATWLLRDDNLYYSQIESGTKPEGIWVHNLTTRAERLIHPAGTGALNRGLALSPDGKWVLYAQTDNADSNVIIADYKTER